MAENARQILALAAERNCRIILPEDAVVAAELASGVAVADRRDRLGRRRHDDPRYRPCNRGDVSAPHSTEADTLVWNGPLGAFETPPFDRGTLAVARKVAELTRAGRLRSVAGGGDTVAALAAAGVSDRSLLCLDSGRRLSRMARRPGITGRCSFGLGCPERLTLLLPAGTFRGTTGDAECWPRMS